MLGLKIQSVTEEIEITYSSRYVMLFLKCFHVHVYVCMCVHAWHVHVYVCRMHVEVRGQLQMSFIKYLAWNSPCSLGWLASEHKGPPPQLCLLSTEIISLLPPCLAGLVF